MAGIFLRALRRYDAFSDLYESQSSLCFMYQVSKHTGSPCIHVLQASRTISIGRADCVPPDRVSRVKWSIVPSNSMLVFGVELFHVFSPHLLQRSIFTSLSSSFSFPFHFLSSLLLLSPSPSSFLALFAPADNEIPATDRDAGKENIFWRGKLSRTRRRKHKQTRLGRRGKGRKMGEEEFSLVMQREAGSTYRQIHNKTIYVFLFLLRSRKRVRSSLSTCLVSGDTGIYNPG